jgi:hypothetical protein
MQNVFIFACMPDMEMHMPRKPQIDAGGLPSHRLRGTERRRIFYEDADSDNFLERHGDILIDPPTFACRWALKYKTRVTGRCT